MREEAGMNTEIVESSNRWGHIKDRHMVSRRVPWQAGVHVEESPSLVRPRRPATFAHHRSARHTCCNASAAGKARRCMPTTERPCHFAAPRGDRIARVPCLR